MKKVTRFICSIIAIIMLASTITEQLVFAADNEDEELINVTITGTERYDYAFKALKIINQYRKAEGLEEYEMNSWHLAESMEDATKLAIHYSHDSPDGSNRAVGMCIAIGYQTPESAVKAWMNSPPHRKIIMDDRGESDSTIRNGLRQAGSGIGCFEDSLGQLSWSFDYGAYGNVKEADYPATKKVTTTIPTMKKLVAEDKWKFTDDQLYVDREYNYGNHEIVPYYLFAKGVIDASNFTITSSNPAVAKVDETKENITIGNAGVATLKATLKEDPSIYFERKITVKPKELNNGSFSLETYRCNYTGQPCKPKVVTSEYIEGKDFKVEYENNIGDPNENAVGAKAVIKGINNYTGTVEQTFSIYKNACLYDVYVGGLDPAYAWKWEYHHNYSTQWTIDTPATCTSEGSKSHHCTVCGEKTDITVIPKTSHTFGEWKTTKQATCTADGVQTRTCSGCGKTETKAITATGHSYTSKITKQPTCTNTGVRTYTCSKCGNTYTEDIKANGHSYSTEWTTDKNATCTTEGSKSHHCTVCGDKTDVTVIPKVAHTYSDYVVEKKPTCTETGIRSYKCTVCGQSIREEIPKLDHNYSCEEILSPTCVETGSVLLTCSECGESHVEAVPAKGHNYTNKVAKPSYTAQGYTIHTCIDCGYSYKDNYTSKFVLGNVSSFKVPATNASAVKLTWNKTSNATGYIVYRYNTSAKKWARIAKVKTNVYIDKKLASGITYKYAVKAYRTENGKEATSPKYPTVTTTTLPANVNFKLASARGKTVVKWSKTRGATGYVVYYKTSAKGKWYRLKVTKGTSYTTTKLRRGRTYYFTVRAYKNLNGKNYYGSFTTKKITAK